MDALLIALLLSAITAAGGRSPLLMRALDDRFANSRAGINNGMFLAIAASAAISAWIGALLAARLTPEARTLLLGVAIGTGGLLLLSRPTPPTRMHRLSSRPFAAATLGFLLVSFSESAQLIIAAVSAARANPWMAGIGGWVGCIIAALMAPALTKATLPWNKTARAAMATLLILLGFFTAMEAMQLL